MPIIRRIYEWLDEQLGLEANILPILRHPVPRETNWWYVFGSATLVAFIVQVVTGVALAFAYVPSPDNAYESLEFITHRAVLGSVVRGIHYFGSSAMVVLVFIHMVQVFIFAAYKYPRQTTWLVGVVLFLMTLAMAFTGQLLRWNQDAYWAVFVVAEQARRTPLIGELLARIIIAGDTVGGATLTRFYATHVFLIPAVIFGAVGLHVYLVVHHGISELPRVGRLVDPRTYKRWYHDLLRRDGEPFWPLSVFRDVVFALAVGSVVVLLAILVGPPELGERADPTNLGAGPKPDWYFLWLFALLALAPPAFEDVMIIGLPALGVLALLAVPFISPFGERSPWRRPWAIAGIVLAVVALGVLIRAGGQALWSPNFEPAPLPAAVTQGISPSAQAGAQLFTARGCANCHAIQGAGGTRGPELTDVGARLTADQLTWRILYGGVNMPAYGTALTPEEHARLVEFLETLEGR
jgi:ubiquinol-cytochrome c reductase cytochrome b subunit